MNIHEYQAKEILSQVGINVGNGKVAYDIEEAVRIASDLNFDKYVVKAQIHAGGRGLGGGVKIANNLDELKKISSEILGMHLVTPQTPKYGKLVRKIYIAQAIEIKQSFYLGIVFDRSQECLSVIASKDGGVNIEQTAKQNPNLIKRISIDPQIGLCSFHILNLIGFFGFDKNLSEKFSKLLKSLYEIYVKKDMNLIEINPLVITDNNELVALDSKLSFDDSALFRHPEILALRDEDEEEPSEIEAKKNGLNYIKLDGNVGCMVNGAGLAMATMDVIEMIGAKPANFLDVGGGASATSVARAFEIILHDDNVKSILVNIFGGIVRCDRIAEGILEATKHIKSNIDIVVRLDGTNAIEAMEILRSARLPNLYVASDLLQGAKMAADLAKEAK
jgi:succinyl-coA ligase [ADP-forming] subunit beta